MRASGASEAANETACGDAGCAPAAASRSRERADDRAPCGAREGLCDAKEGIAQENSPLADVVLRRQRAFYTVGTIIGAAAIVWIVGYLLDLLSVPVGIVIWTAVIVFCLRGPVSFFERKGVSRTVGTALAYVLMVVVLGLLALVMFSPIFGLSSQFRDLITSMPGYVNQFITWAQGFYSEYSHLFDNETVRQWLEMAFSALSDGASALAGASAAGVVEFGASVGNTLIAVGFALVVAFWVLMDLPALGRECMRLVGERRREDAKMLHLTFTRVMGGYIKATVLQCVIIGVGGGVLFSVCGIPNFAALGAISGVLNIIPIVGPWLGGVLAGAVGLFVSPFIALVAVVGTIAIQQVVYTFVSPRIMQSSVDVHPAVTFIALMAGSAIGAAMSGLPGSLVGMLLSIPAVAVMKSVFVYYFEKRTGRRLVAADGVFFKGAPAEGDAVDPIVDATEPYSAAPTSKKRTGKDTR